MSDIEPSNSKNLDEEKKYQCENCSYIAPHRSFYNWHNWYVHDENLIGYDLPVYRCQKCNFESKIQLHFHRHCQTNKCIQTHKQVMSSSNWPVYRCQKCKYE